MNDIRNWGPLDSVRAESWQDQVRALERHPRLTAEEGEAGCRRFYCRTLSWLGGWLVYWGWRLQERYASPGPTVSMSALDGGR